MREKGFFDERDAKGGRPAIILDEREPRKSTENERKQSEKEKECFNLSPFYSSALIARNSLVFDNNRRNISSAPSQAYREKERKIEKEKEGKCFSACNRRESVAFIWGIVCED